MLYFAYGANTNRAAMKYRCPQATPVGAAVLFDYALRFKVHADIEPARGEKVHGALWDISARDERALDMFEGYPNYYIKSEVRVRHNGRWVLAMAYVMREREWLSYPAVYYESTLRVGYASFRLPVVQLERALFDAAVADYESLDGTEDMPEENNEEMADYATQEELSL